MNVQLIEENKENEKNYAFNNKKNSFGWAIKAELYRHKWRFSRWILG